MQIRHFVLRYGVFVLLFFMSLGLLHFVCNFELHVKTPIHLFYNSNDGSWYGYISNQEAVEFKPNDTLMILQSSMGNWPCCIENINKESGLLRIKLTPTDKDKAFVNTYSEGFIYNKKKKMKDRIFHRY